METQQMKAWQVMGEAFELNTRYKVVDYLGSGAYGMVCAVQDNQDNSLFAIKKCKKIFQSRTLAKRALREMRLLRHLSHENIVKLKSIFPPADIRFYQDLYLVFELMDTDLAQIIRSPQPLKEQHTQYFIYQLLRGLEYLHSMNIVHRDIKPRNILVNADCTLKIADFGLARMYKNDGPESVTAITDYVTTRWYRAPEVIVGWSRYSSAIDMWAVGCITAELIARSPLFPGENTMKQLGLIIRILGSPHESFILKSQKTMFRQYMLTLLGRKSYELNLLLPNASPEALDLIQRLLNYEPGLRPHAAQCLLHSFIKGMSASLTPPVCSPIFVPQEEFDFERRKLTLDDLRAELTHEVSCYNRPELLQSEVLVPFYAYPAQPTSEVMQQHSNSVHGFVPQLPPPAQTTAAAAEGEAHQGEINPLPPPQQGYWSSPVHSSHQQHPQHHQQQYPVLKPSGESALQTHVPFYVPPQAQHGALPVLPPPAGYTVKASQLRQLDAPGNVVETGEDSDILVQVEALLRGHSSEDTHDITAPTRQQQQRNALVVSDKQEESQQADLAAKDLEAGGDLTGESTLGDIYEEHVDTPTTADLHYIPPVRDNAPPVERGMRRRAHSTSSAETSRWRPSQLTYSHTAATSTGTATIRPKSLGREARYEYFPCMCEQNTLPEHTGFEPRAGVDEEEGKMGMYQEEEGFAGGFGEYVDLDGELASHSRGSEKEKKKRSQHSGAGWTSACIVS